MPNTKLPPYMNMMTRKITTPQEFALGFLVISELSRASPWKTHASRTSRASAWNQSPQPGYP